MNLNWEYNKIRRDYTAKTELSVFSVWINVSADQFISTADLEKRLREIESTLDSVTTESLVDFCAQLMTAINKVK